MNLSTTVANSHSDIPIPSSLTLMRYNSLMKGRNMGRYRPPTAKKSPYITVEGYAELQAELQQLWVRRKDVTMHLSAAAAEGDRSENAEYIYRKKELREIDYRIRYLQKRLPDLTVVDRPPPNPLQIFFGAWIELEDDEGSIMTYRIVGPDELNPQKGYISVDSPIARGLLKKHADDEVNILTPQGEINYLILHVKYS